jgi:hypothetical protein
LQKHNVKDREGILLINHAKQEYVKGKHNLHHFMEGLSVKEFVNRDSLFDYVDLNADNIVTLGMMERPLLLTIVDNDLRAPQN